jgi:hypothetical protein
MKTRVLNISAFLPHSRTEWDYYFPETNPNYFTSRQTPSSSNVYVSNCLFESITSTSGHGGALFCTSATYFLVESTSFFSCRTSSSYGGAIYFSNTGGQSVLHDVCGYGCCSTHASSPCHQFARIEVSNTASSNNYVNCSSIAYCVSGNPDSYYALGLFSGKMRCPSVNISLNKCYGRTVWCSPFADSNSATSSFLYSSFADNTLAGFTCFMLWMDNANFEIKSCNIIRNTQSNLGTEGTICTKGNLLIEDSCILENKATYIFNQQNSLNTITLSNCTVDKTTNNQKLVTQNMATKSFILGLNHIFTQNCHAEYDSVGFLTPIAQSSPYSKKQRSWCSCERFLYKCAQEDLFLLTFISSVLSILPQ